jgi:hypothetical protein
MEGSMIGSKRGFFLIAVIVMAIIGWSGFAPANAAIVMVTNANDGGGGSLRDAITAAAPGDTINFGGSVTGTITLTTGELLINKNLTISGPGASSLTISGNGASRVFEIAGGITATISGLSVKNGSADNGGGILVNNLAVLNLSDCVVSNNQAVTGIAQGGGILTVGTLNLSNSTISGNVATEGGAGLRIFSGATVAVSGCAITGNQAPGYGAGGGGIETQGALMLTNSTISGNAAVQGSGGGVSVEDGLTTLLNDTIAFNTASGSSGANLDVYGDTSVATTKNTIISNPVTAPNCRVAGGGTLTSNGYNLESTNTCGFTGTGDITGTDPLLGALALNAPGATETHAILAGSPAIDAADPAVFPPTDQRGVKRPQGPRADIGAYEIVAATAAAVAVPAMTQWGMLAFVLLAGLWSVSFLRSRKKEG